MTLHDGSIAGLRIQNHLLALIVHQMKVRLFKVPRVNVDVKEINSRHETIKLSFKHVEVLLKVHEDGVKDKGLVIIGAVQSFASAHRE